MIAAQTASMNELILPNQSGKHAGKEKSIQHQRRNSWPNSSW